MVRVCAQDLVVCVFLLVDSRSVVVSVDLNKQLRDNYVKACKYEQFSRFWAAHDCFLECDAFLCVCQGAGD
jgi:hypothetical protein